MFGEGDHLAGQQLQRPARAPRRWCCAGGGDEQRLLLAVELAKRARAGLLVQGRFEIAFHEAPPGAIDRRAADAHARRGLRLAQTLVRRQQDPGAFDLAHRVLAAVQQRLQLVLLVLVQLDTPTYVHRDALLQGHCDESKASAASPSNGPALH